MTHEGQKGELSACAGGTCSLFNCDASRGPVECVNGKCQCGSTKFCFGWYSHVLDRGGGQFVGSLLLDVLPLRLLVAEANRDTVLIQVVHAFRSMTLFPTTVTEPQHGTASWFGHETSCFANSHVSYSAMDCWAVRASEIKRSIACSIPAYCHLGFEMAMWPCNPRICGCVVVILPTNGSGFGAAHGCNSHVEKIRRFQSVIVRWCARFFGVTRTTTPIERRQDNAKHAQTTQMLNYQRTVHADGVPLLSVGNLSITFNASRRLQTCGNENWTYHGYTDDTVYIVALVSDIFKVL